MAHGSLVSQCYAKVLDYLTVGLLIRTQDYILPCRWPWLIMFFQVFHLSACPFMDTGEIISAVPYIFDHPVTDLAMPLIFFIKFSFREECQEFSSTPNMDKY